MASILALAREYLPQSFESINLDRFQIDCTIKTSLAGTMMTSGVVNRQGRRIGSSGGTKPARYLGDRVNAHDRSPCRPGRSPESSETWEGLVPIERLNPTGMHSNPAYSQGVSVPANARYIHVGGQNGIDAAGNILGDGDLAAQTTQALANLATVLRAGGAAPENLISVTVYLVGDADLRAAFGAWAWFWKDRGTPPIVKVLRVSGLANPGFLIEVEAIAAVVENGR